MMMMMRKSASTADSRVYWSFQSLWSRAKCTRARDFTLICFPRAPKRVHLHMRVRACCSLPTCDRVTFVGPIGRLLRKLTKSILLACRR